MRLVIATEMRFLSFSDGVYTELLGDSTYWTRYTKVFDSILVIARVRAIAELPPHARRSDAAGVSFWPLPDYVGPWEGLASLPTLLIRTWRAARTNQAFLLRLPGAVGSILHLWLWAQHRPFGVRILGDPHESLSPSAIRTKWSHLFRPGMASLLRLQCRTAACVSYVTERSLQEHYPSEAMFVNYYSDVDLADDLFAVMPREPLVRKSPTTHFRLVFVGSLAQRYKGLHTLLEAVKKCVSVGLNLSLDVLGSGQYARGYSEQATALGIAELVAFHGHISREQLFAKLRSADLFVLPSLTEGMPRALLEAMACGLPCIASAVGGVPEVLASEDTFPPGNADQLAGLIQTVLANPARMHEMSQRNLQMARNYRSSVLQMRRTEFYHALRELSAVSDSRALKQR